MAQKTVLTLCYGQGEPQCGDLYLPAAAYAPVICLLHGGFWRAPYGRDQFAAVAEDLVSQGFAVWNLGYRRVGDAGGGWPGMFDDVSSGINFLATISASVCPLDLSCVTLAGHSAGGHLALWGAVRERFSSVGIPEQTVHVARVAALAAITDLAWARQGKLGRDAVMTMVDGAHDLLESLYASASPSRLLPLRVPQLLLHGATDDFVPSAMSIDYARAASMAGDRIELHILDDTGHMDFLDPGSAAHQLLCAWLQGSPG